MNKEDPNKNEGARVATTLNIDFSHSQGQITLQSRVGSGLVTCKNEEDLLKNKDARAATTQNIDFSHSQGQITAV